MNFPLSISKEEINKLPLYNYTGEIILIDTTEKMNQYLDILLSEFKNEKFLGFDTETRASFKKGERYKISLLQLATSSKVYLFRLHMVKLPQEIIDILSSPNIKKVGVAIRDDIKGLKKIFTFNDEGFLDLAKLAQEKEIKNFGLRALTAIFLKKRLSKKEKVSNWEKLELSSSQIKYAASDAAVGFEIYKVMLSN